MRRLLDRFRLIGVRFGILLLSSVIILAGCQRAVHRENVIQYFDESTGATITTLMNPFSFYRQEPMLSANSRDYIYAGPLEVNDAGSREYFLWLHFCSTIDRSRHEGVDAPEGIFIFFDGKPMELIRARGIGSDRLRDAKTYSVSIAGGYAAFYRVTRDQLSTLARAGRIRVIADDESGNAIEYGVWKGAGRGLRLFGQYLASDEDIVASIR